MTTIFSLTSFPRLASRTFYFLDFSPISLATAQSSFTDSLASPQPLNEEGYGSAPLSCSSLSHYLHWISYHLMTSNTISLMMMPQFCLYPRQICICSLPDLELICPTPISSLCLFWLHGAACGIFPNQRSNPCSLHTGRKILNYWTARKSPRLFLDIHISQLRLP